MIKKEGDRWVLHSSDGSKKLGSFPSKEAALKREKQINFFKAIKDRKIPLSKIKNKELAK